MNYRTFITLVTLCSGLIAPTASSAWCLTNCPPSNSTVVSDLASRTIRAMGQSLKAKSATFVDSQDVNNMGVPIYQAWLDADFIFADGTPLGATQRVAMIYEKRNSGWVLVEISCKVCNLP
jgi:hypothetical protein